MAKKKYNQIMVDLETLGTRADSVILSIGAVKFNIDSREIDDAGFYASVSVDSNHEVKPRHIDESTLMWWLKREPAAQQVFFEEKTTLGTALENFSDWVDHDEYHVWGNGADFDISMLAHAFHTFGMNAPWKFYNVRCFRTLKNSPFARRAAKPANPLAHNALHDAVTQVKHLLAIYDTMKEAA